MKNYGGSGFLGLPWTQQIAALPLKGTSAHRGCNTLIGKDSDAGRDWRQEKKGTTEDEMAGWHH